MTTQNTFPFQALLICGGLEKTVQVTGKGNKGYKVILNGESVWVSPIFLHDLPAQ